MHAEHYEEANFGSVAQFASFKFKAEFCRPHDEALRPSFEHCALSGSTGEFPLIGIDLQRTYARCTARRFVSDYESVLL